MSGWFSVKRGITAHPIFKGHPERLAIWIWLLDNAAWQDTEHDVNGKTVTIKRGSVAASERRIAAEVGVGYQVVRTFLARLKAEHMINAEVTHGKNVITLCNWGKYQSSKNVDNAAPNAALTHDKRTKETMEQIPTTSGASAPVDPVKVLFDAGITVLGASGIPAQRARQMVGRWRQAHGDAATVAALGKAQREGAIDPVGFIEGCFRASTSVSKSGAPDIGAVRVRPDGARQVYMGNGVGWVVQHA